MGGGGGGGDGLLAGEVRVSYAQVCRWREAVCRRLQVTHTTHASSGERLSAPLTEKQSTGEGW